MQECLAKQPVSIVIKIDAAIILAIFMFTASFCFNFRLNSIYELFNVQALKLEYFLYKSFKIGIISSNHMIVYFIIGL